MDGKNSQKYKVSSEYQIIQPLSLSPNTRNNYFKQDHEPQQNSHSQQHSHPQQNSHPQYNYYPQQNYQPQQGSQLLRTNYFNQTKQSGTEKINDLKINSQNTSEKSIPNPLQHKLTNQDYEIFSAEVDQYNYDYFSTDQSKYDQLLIIEKSLFYFNSQRILQEKSKQYYKADGKLYRTNFDKDKNPKFIIKEGQFRIFLSENQFLLHGSGKEYSGKSTLIKFEGQFETDIFKDYVSNQRSKTAPTKMIRIIDVETGLQVNKNNQVDKYRNQFLYCESWCKYNQQISLKDIQILENNRRLTSSIIDAYVLYLNLENERMYFSKEKKMRQNIDRILFLPTTLTTNFGKNYTDQHTKGIFEAELLEFQDLNYNLKKIYSQIGLPVNKNNYHWYFLLFDLKQNSCTVFDSLQKPTDQMNVDSQLILTLEKLLKIERCNKQLSYFSGEQTDGYSCGYHVCQFMDYCKEVLFKPKVNYCFNLNEIKTKLLTIIKK